MASVHPIDVSSVEKNETSEKEGSGMKKEKILLIVSIVLGTIAAGLLIGLIIVATKSPETTTSTTAPASENLCISEACIERSLWIMRAIDQNVDPCTDFYQYACGKWIADTEFPGDKSRIGTFDGINDNVQKMLNKTLMTRAVNANNPNANAQDKAAFIYQQCYKSDSNDGPSEDAVLTQLRAVLDGTGNCPLLSGSWSAGTFSRTDFMAKVQSLTMSTFLSIGVWSDLKDSNRNRITLLQPSLNLPTKAQLLDTASETYITYRQFVIDMFVELARTGNPSLDNAALVSQVDSMLAFERLLANATFNADEVRDETALYEIKNFVELPPVFRDVIAAMLRQLKDATIADNEGIQTFFGPGFLANFVPIITNANAGDLANYGIWSLIRGTLFQGLPQRLRELETKLYNRLRGSQPPPRWTSCMQLADGYLTFGVGRLYVDNNFDKLIKKDMIEQIKYITDEFRANSLESSSWITKETKAATIEKLEKMGNQIAYPDFIENDEQLTKYHADTVLPTGSQAPLVSIINAAAIGSTKLELGKWITKVADRKAWFTGPQTVNAFYSPSQNAIYFPGGILYPPFYHRDLPKSMNFGGIGYVIGHEITHGFDDQGRKYDKDGNFMNWWDDASVNEFNSRAKCYIDQYSRQCFPNVAGSPCVNGEFTQGENIADDGGVRSAFEAYESWKTKNKDSKLPGLTHFSDEQLFFLTSAHVWCLKQTDQRLTVQLQTDPHAPMPYRVNLPLQNFDSFSKVWQCKAGSPMNPSSTQKCRIW